MTVRPSLDVFAFGLPAILLLSGAWLICKALAEIGGALTLPNPKGCLR